MRQLRFSAPLLVSIFSWSVLSTYTLQQDYTGANFFNGFDFFTDPDPTDGHVQFLSMSEANESAIAGLIDGGNANTAVYLAVDSTDLAPNGRNSVRVSSQVAYHHALVVADIAHMPGGICGTWPAFWMVGPNWPNDGEIDIVEGVNDQGINSMTLHTSEGVVVQNTSDVAGLMQTANCDVNAANQAQNAGCSFMAESNLTFGEGFNQAGGGIYVTEWTSTAIKIWYFPRGNIPADITAGSPSPADTWGTPNSIFQGDFNMDEHFTDLNIVFDTTFCGFWAGAVWSSSSCASLAPTCEDYVTSNPAAFKDAYWAINTLQVFQDNTDTSAVMSRRSPESADWGVSGDHLAQHRRRLRRSRSRSGGAVLPSRA